MKSQKQQVADGNSMSCDAIFRKIGFLRNHHFLRVEKEEGISLMLESSEIALLVVRLSEQTYVFYFFMVPSCQ